MKKLLLLCLLLMATTIANADGTLNTTYIASIMSLAESKWLPIVTANSIKIFTILWALETFTTCITNKFFDFTKTKELFRFLAVRIAFMSVFTVILMKPDLYLGIIQLFVKMGQSGMSGMQGGSSTGYAGLDAGWVWHQYAQWFNNAVPALMADAKFSPSEILSLGFAEIIYMLCTIYISFLVIMMNIEITCIIFGALILTGFAGSDWTKKWWDSYLGMVISMGLKIMLFCFLYAGLENILAYKDGKAGHVVGIDMWTMVVNCIICTLALGIIPGKIAGAISSAASGSTGGEAIGGFMAGLAVAKTVVSPAKTLSKMVGNAKNIMGNFMDKASGSSTSGGTSGGGDKGSSGGKSQQPTANSEDKSEFMKSGSEK